MPVGSFALALSLPLVWGGFADPLWKRIGVRREYIVAVLALLLGVRLALGGVDAVTTVMAAMPAALALFRPPTGRLRRVGFLLILCLLGAMGAIEMASLAFMGMDPVIWAPVTIGVLAGLWAADAVSAFGMGALSALVALLLPLGPEAAPADPFQFVWGAALVGGWVGLAVERALSVARSPNAA